MSATASRSCPGEEKYTVYRSKFSGPNGRALEVCVIRVSALLTVALASWLSAVHARQAPAAAAASPPKPLIPTAANSIALTPEAFYGQNVTVMASVDAILSPTSFTIDQDSAKTGPGVLVLVGQLSAPLQVNSYVTVIGEVVRHEGQPAIRATSVLTSTMLDLAKRVLPPMTAEEEAFDKVMKGVNPAFAAVRQAVAATTAGTAGESIASLKKSFAETEAFWRKRGKPDAEKWAVDARLQSETLERSIAAGRWDEAKAAVGALQQACSGCHGTYRERQDDGSYRIKP
jgi:cytochrome c556